MTGASLADPVATRDAVGLCSGLLEDVLDCGPCSGGTTGHERRAISGTLLTTRDTGADEKQALGFELLGATNGIRVVRVTTVDDNITGLEMRDELADEVVDGATGLHEEDNFARRLKF